MLQWLRKVFGMLSLEEECSAVRAIAIREQLSADHAYATYAVIAARRGYEKASKHFMSELVREHIRCREGLA